MITPAEFEDRMREIKEAVDRHDHVTYDEESGHFAADHLMCTVLKSLGYVKGVEIFEQLDKWYS